MSQIIDKTAEMRKLVAEEAALRGRARTFVLEDIAHCWGGKRNTPECAAKIRVFEEAAEVARGRLRRLELPAQPVPSLFALAFYVLALLFALIIDPG